MGTKLTAGLFLVIGFVMTSSLQTRACQNSGATRVIISSGTSVVVSPSYAPSAPSDRITSFDVIVTNPHNSKSCSFALSFTRASLPAVMVNGASTLQYAIETSGGSSLLQTTGYVFGTSPAAGNRLAGFVAPASSTTLSVRVRIPAGQSPLAAGSYSDSSVVIGLYEISGTGVPIANVYETTFAVSTSVASGCTLPPASPASLNFTSAISNGVPNPAVVLTTTFAGVACSAPARIRLDGSAMVPTPAAAPVSGLDAFINWQAQAIFGSATATLATNVASSVTSAGYNVPSGATAGGTITVNVNLIAGQPLLAGAYSSVLTVTIDPNL